MATKIWTAPVTGIWSDKTKWAGGLAPVTNDVIQIGDTAQASAFTVTENVTQTIASLTMAGNHKANQSTTLTLTQPAVLTVNGPISFDGDSFINGSGTLVANGAISGLGTIIASNGGTLDITGTGSIASGVVLDFDASTTAASTLKLDLSGGITSAANIRMNNTAPGAGDRALDHPDDQRGGDVLERHASACRAARSSTRSASPSARGSRRQHHRLRHDRRRPLWAVGRTEQTDTVTASGGTLVLTGGLDARQSDASSRRSTRSPARI